MYRIAQLAKIRSLNRLDYSYILFVVGHFICLPFLIYFTELHLVVFISIESIILYLSIIFIYEIYNNFSDKDQEVKPHEYKYFLWISVIFQISIIIFSVSIAVGVGQRTPSMYFLTIVLIAALFSYLFIVLIFLLLLLDYCYYILLKKIFPKERSESSQEVLSIAVLSESLDLPEQKLYLNTSIINFVIYILVVIYIFLGIMSLVPTEDYIINIIVKFSKQNSIASFGNTLGLISLAIAIYTTTYTVQGKIYEKALKKYNEETNETTDD